MEPGLRPSESDQLSSRRIGLGLAFLILGFIGIFFGGSDAVGQAFFFSGSTLMAASLFVFRRHGFGFQRGEEDHDVRKLYGTPKD